MHFDTFSSLRHFIVSFVIQYSGVDLSVMSPAELADELGTRVRSERLRQNLSQATLAERAGVSRITVTRMEAGGGATLVNFLSVLAALRRTGDLEHLLVPPEATTIEQFLGSAQPLRQRGRR
jgi:DNA-binding XRE family transcriptional regulator